MDGVVHFEIPIEDEGRATKFYEKVFGWKVQAVPDMSYHMVHTVDVDEKHMPKEAGKINGGFYKKGGKGSQTSVIVINVANVDKHIKKIEAAGGKLFMPKNKVGDMGYYAQVKDTEGNIVGIWETIPKK